MTEAIRVIWWSLARCEAKVAGRSRRSIVLAIKVVPYTADRVPGVAAFNRRMQDGGSRWGWYEESEDSWLPPGPDRSVWREHFLAVDDDEEVHGAYALKPQGWSIKGEHFVVSDWQGPVSEGAVSPKHNMVGMRLFRDMVKRRALLYSWGHGEDVAMLQMLKAIAAAKAIMKV